MTRDGSRNPVAAQPRAGDDRRWTATVGAAAGAVSAVAFTALHGALIVDVWNRAAAMTLSGALCGWCLAWSHRRLGIAPTAGGWLAYIAAHVALLLALGAASLLLLDPVASMAEMTASVDPLGDLAPAALPLMAGTAIMGSVTLWTVFGRPAGSLPSVLVAHTLLVVLIGHNLAILGLVELADPIAAAGTMAGATAFLGGSFALAHLALLRARRVVSLRSGTREGRAASG